MEEKTFARLKDWVEPAHPMVVKFHDDLLTIYKHIRGKYQGEIDKAFDRVSQQIGFVVTTTVPMVLELGEKGKVKRISMGAEHLKDTLFARELISKLEMLMDSDPIPAKEAGIYNLQLFWFDALKLKLHTDWMEPAHFPKDWLEPVHFFRRRIPERERYEVVWEAHEPAHWFDPRVVISVKEAVLISVIDEVYPELRLTDRIGSSRHEMGRMLRTGEDPTPEPAGPTPGSADKILTELASVLRRYGY